MHMSILINIDSYGAHVCFWGYTTTTCQQIALFFYCVAESCEVRVIQGKRGAAARQAVANELRQEAVRAPSTSNIGGK